MTEVVVKVDSVCVDGRHRRDLGDIEALAQSIKSEGLINPITITPDGRLLAGERRLVACRALGRETIEAHVVDTLDDAMTRLRIERDENTQRKPMTPSELVSLGAALEALEQRSAATRKTLHGGTAPGRGSDRGLSNTGVLQNTSVPTKTREVVGEALGMSGGSYYRAKFVVGAANDASLSQQERAVAQEALADMDSGNGIAPAYNRVRNATKTRTGSIRPTTIDAAGAQRRSISSAEAALSGISHGLKQIVSLHADITSEEAARWVDSLLDSRRVITSLISLLKERTNAQQS